MHSERSLGGPKTEKHTKWVGGRGRENEWGAGGGDGKAKCFFFGFEKENKSRFLVGFCFASANTLATLFMFVVYFYSFSSPVLLFFSSFCTSLHRSVTDFYNLVHYCFWFQFFFVSFWFFLNIFLLAFWFSTSRFFFFCFCRNYIKTHYINHLLHSLSVLSFLVVLVKQRFWRLTTKTMSMVDFSNSKITCKHTHNILLTTRYPTYCFSIRYKD